MADVKILVGSEAKPIIKREAIAVMNLPSTVIG
jgi:hypothetical protein